MRTTLSCLQRRQLCVRTSSLLHITSTCTSKRVCCTPLACWSRRSWRVMQRHFHQSMYKKDAQYHRDPIPFVNEPTKPELVSNDLSPQVKAKQRKRIIPRLSKEQLQNADTWVNLLENYLPSSVRQNDQHEGSTGIAQEPASELGEACEAILTILDAAREKRHADTEILIHMLLNGRKKSVLHIADMLVRNIASRFPARPASKTPSNILWPGTTLNTLCAKPIELDTNFYVSNENLDASLRQEVDPRYTLIQTEIRDRTMTEIWAFLGILFAQSANLAKTQALDFINVALQIIGQIHNSDLVPENVYTYRPSPLTTTVQRPPILHLVSSRILTALSDAAWRENQQRMIEKAASLGVSYDEIAREAPGGRFRLKVRPLEPEIWLEFVLWCCVEGGFSTSGSRIVKYLREQDDPWFAVTWTPAIGMSQIAPLVDWDRVRLRYGGSVGLIEGYSREKPFVTMPPRTVSTEVVLGLVNASIDTMNHGESRGTKLELVQRYITNMVSFLEPHDLPVGYFDYLAVRLMQTGAFDLPANAAGLRAWYDQICSLRALEPAYPRQPPRVSFQLESLATHSELLPGILHQALDGHVQSGDIHQALDAFNVIQEHVDASKLQAIGTFLDSDVLSEESTGSGYNAGYYNRQDFVSSHGQLPLYKLAGLLDLATDTGLVGFGQWLLYSDDPDGAPVRTSEYANTAIARPLLRFAAISDDARLRSQILITQSSARRKKTVRFLRTLIQTNISMMNFTAARGALAELSGAEGGGPGLENIAHLAGTILKIEAGNMGSKARQRHLLAESVELLEDLLQGSFDASFAFYTQDVRGAYLRNVASLLQLFQFYTESVIKQVAARYSEKFSMGNTSSLPPRVFNVFMESVVDVMGSQEGVRLWETFCAAGVDQTRGQDARHFGDTDIDDLQPTDDAEDNLESEETRPGATRVEDTDTGPTTNVAGIRQSICVPDQRTLRIIVRRAIRDKGLPFAKSQLGNMLQQRDEVIEWALQQFKKFGVSQRMVETELQERLTDTQVAALNLKDMGPVPIRRAKSLPVRRTRKDASAIESQFRSH